jgi:hypothetical protein
MEFFGQGRSEGALPAFRRMEADAGSPRGFHAIFARVCEMVALHFFGYAVSRATHSDAKASKIFDPAANFVSAQKN